jgi:hypothetical protein
MAVNPKMGEPRGDEQKFARRPLFHFTVNPNFLLYAVKNCEVKQGHEHNINL